MHKNVKLFRKIINIAKYDTSISQETFSRSQLHTQRILKLQFEYEETDTASYQMFIIISYNYPIYFCM